ncbi:hypothetical protein CRUP_004662 [Coryphaenoides rupestris]|nr:hypothetical protein CRUP_004662 [Coryphaenoides rupestris]
MAYVEGEFGLKGEKVDTVKTPKRGRPSSGNGSPSNTDRDNRQPFECSEETILGGPSVSRQETL